MLPATALAPLITGCAQQTFTVQNKPAVAPKETITHHFFVSGIGQKKTVDAAKICGGAENVVKTKTRKQTFVNGLLGFITLGIYTPLGRVCIHNNCNIAHRYGQLYLHCSLIYFWVPSSCFWYSDQPLSEGEIILFSGCLPVGGEAALSTPEAVVASRTD